MRWESENVVMLLVWIFFSNVLNFGDDDEALAAKRQEDRCIIKRHVTHAAAQI